MSMASEFKEFALKGNVVDMAIGVIVGGAFGKIVSSLVGDVIMPPIGKMIGGVSFAELAVSLGMGPDGKTPVLLKYGAFLQTIIDFAIIAFVLFMAIRAMNSLKKAPPPAPAVPPPPPRSEVLLEEIRNLLAKR